MPRRKKDAAIHLADRHELTAGLIESLTCPTGKTQAFLRDANSPGLRVRVTTAGAKSYVFEGKLNRQTIRHTIGDVRTWTIPAARVEANRLRSLLDVGTDLSGRRQLSCPPGDNYPGRWRRGTISLISGVFAQQGRAPAARRACGSSPRSFPGSSSGAPVGRRPPASWPVRRTLRPTARTACWP